MNVPKFKPTKWKLYYCLECKQLNTRGGRYYCTENKHHISDFENVPFFVSDMKIKHFWGKWSELRSDKMDKNFSLSASKLKEIIFGCGIGSGGQIPNQWWMYNKVGGSLTITWVKNG